MSESLPGDQHSRKTEKRVLRHRDKRLQEAFHKV